MYKLACSHTIPSLESTAYKASISKEHFHKEFQITLSEDDKALLVKVSKKNPSPPLVGKWTMVYDEGFDINIGDYSFFAFSKYSPNTSKKKFFFTNKKNSKWVSKCYSTLIGWYHKGDEWGCYYAEKVGVDPNKITNEEVQNKLVVIENSVKTTNEDEISFMENKIKLSTEEGLESHFSTELSNSMKSSLKLNSLNFNMNSSKSRITTYNSSELVSKINKMQTMWEAKNYKEFSNMSLKELNKFAGRKKHHFHKHGGEKKYIGKNFHFHSWVKHPTSEKQKKLNNIKSQKEDNYGLPENFLEWVHYMPEPRNQGHCGSCYAVATLNMLESRLKIKNKIEEKLSLEHVLNCSVYNQGCDGGYSYLVLKFGHELEMIPEKCENFNHGTYSCNKKCPSYELQKRTYKVENFHYIGGSYGKCSEELIMKEVMANGPVVVSFEPDFNFMYYKKGIYMSLSENNWMKNSLPRPEWEKVDHSVTLVGWGYDEEHKQKYWLLMNSWGKNWGEEGYFKMVRGSDHMGIESICEAGSLTYNDL